MTESPTMFPMAQTACSFNRAESEQLMSSCKGWMNKQCGPWSRVMYCVYCWTMVLGFIYQNKLNINNTIPIHTDNLEVLADEIVTLFAGLLFGDGEVYVAGLATEAKSVKW